MTKIKVTRAYRDLELGRFVREGEILDVSDERASLLLSKSFVKVIEIKEDIVEKQEKPEIKTKELKTNKKTK
jgi:hypothetical protein